MGCVDVSSMVGRAVLSKILFVVNVDWFFISHRLPIALEALRRGYEVYLACAFSGKRGYLEELGLITHKLPLSRSGSGLATELKSLLAIRRVVREINPDVVHLVTIKPVLYGGIVCRLLGVKRAVAAVSGLGFVFTDRGFKAKLLRFVVERFYRAALSWNNMTVIVQNRDDYRILSEIGAFDCSESVLIRGAGVDLASFKPSVHREQSYEKGSHVTLMFMARLLGDKGINEFIDAAEILSERSDCSFLVVGDLDEGNPNSLTKDDLERIDKLAFIKLLGFAHDAAATTHQADVVVLPSYREGLPKSLLEAAACGKPVITTDVPGCRDAIEPNVTGLLVPSKDPVKLAEAMQYLIDNPDVRQKMGQEGRRLAEEAFDIKLVVKKHMEIYGFDQADEPDLTMSSDS